MNDYCPSPHKIILTMKRNCLSIWEITVLSAAKFFQWNSYHNKQDPGAEVERWKATLGTHK